ncbi:MAG: glycosyltransferase family 39 protein [Acidobacteriota bacterium]|nr:glycosyltransferase family 39 protein [Acidobacteriota bacterium]
MNDLAPNTHRWRPASLAILCLAWLVLQPACIFSPGLLDDVDSIYIEIAREMLHRHDYVTPYINGIRFFDKPPLMYWMAAGSMHVFGETDWAARLPLTLAVLALLLATYALGNRLFQADSPQHAPDRGGLYAALALATGIGPFLYTRFYIPDILICLWMTLGVHLFLIALDRIHSARSALLPCAGFAAVTALNLLTKGLIGIVFPIGFVLGYLLLTRELRLLTRLHLAASTAVFAAIAAPWHILAALRTPAIAMPAGVGLPARAGWAWFYLYNEHIARFLSKRIPHDYGQTPVWLFWTLAAVWVMPWTPFLPGAIAHAVRTLRSRAAIAARQHQSALSLLLWALLVLGFFTLSARQEYYSLPALPALALLAGGLLARADSGDVLARASALRWSAWLLLPVASLIALVCGFFAITAPHAAPGTDIATLLSQNPEFYNLSLGHIFDLTGAAMGLFRGPLTAVALSMIGVGAASHLLRRRGSTYAANLTLAASMVVSLLAMHAGLARFYPTLGSKSLADAINTASATQPGLIILDGELTSGSTLVFYTRQQVHLIDGRVNGLWFGSFWPDAPAIFETDASLYQRWSGPGRVFLLTYNAAARTSQLARYGTVHTLASAGGKTVLSNQ